MSEPQHLRVVPAQRKWWIMPPDPTPLLTRVSMLPVLTIERVEQAMPLARALVAGGLPLIEVALRTDASAEAARAIAREVPGAVLGIGTVTRLADIQLALEIGAQFLVTPGTPPELAVALAKVPLPVLPGCATPSEAMALSQHGFRALKFFPASSSGGVEFLRQIAGPLPRLKFVPSGGVDERSAADYLAQPNVIAVSGTWVVPREAVEAGDFSRVTALARAAASLRR
ncbi:MAG TPA: bifunctional 4-hydroxy-2-oxoglutarate aldolase/2-dehydro-3-deoxy-phosphogluconate aldolase [Xanthobacteraceae bacterium]|jgi:2-dehydro-3-deoxyphosphogluconate aldolase/(4S)-4-hydroxy-2-oxoglutarate aldolase|nr:bifunctional 4-hydroxy-2-oxoglutarate aldolase/2-dehydro-3-deoxy-phosphogluconate aldolase [Xanthobacteraceae bacterium]